MRWLKAIALGLAVGLVAAPLLAANKPNRGECNRMTRQMARYERDAKWAAERGDALWREASRDRVDHLEDRRDALCPHMKKKNPIAAAAAKAADLIAAAAKAAAPYFIPGP